MSYCNITIGTLAQSKLLCGKSTELVS